MVFPAPVPLLQGFGPSLPTFHGKKGHGGKHLYSNLHRAPGKTAPVILCIRFPLVSRLLLVYTKPQWSSLPFFVQTSTAFLTALIDSSVSSSFTVLRLQGKKQPLNPKTVCCCVASGNVSSIVRAVLPEIESALT